MAAKQNRDRQGAEVSTYLITFVCYGTWLPGEPGAVDLEHNLYGGSYAEDDPDREAGARRRMIHAPYLLDAARRSAVLRALREVCVHRRWLLLAAHVRLSHVHAVVAANQTPENVMGAFKAYASRALSTGRFDEPDRRRWARHGSTRYLWSSADVNAAMHYVVAEQGEPMDVWELAQ